MRNAQNPAIQQLELSDSNPQQQPGPPVPYGNHGLGDAPVRYALAQMDRDAVGPEDANADFALADPLIYHQSALLQIPSVIFLQGKGLVTKADYNMLANYQYFRDAMSTVNALGRNDQTEFPAWTANSVDFKVGAPSAPNFVVGVIIEWALQLQVSSAFTMSVTTTNFKGLSAQNLNRSVNIRLGPGTVPDSMAFANGGMFALLFAQRLDIDDLCGCGNGSGCVTPGGGGMQKAVVQPAWIAPMNPPDYTTELGAVDPYFTPYVTGLTVPFQTPDIPQVNINVSANIGAGFGYTARYLTAASPSTASVLGALRASGIGLQLNG